MALHGGNDPSMAPLSNTSTTGAAVTTKQPMAPTSLIEWNNLQQHTAGQVDLTKLLESIRNALRSGDIMAWVTWGLNLDKAQSAAHSGGLGKGSVKRVFNESNVDARAMVQWLCQDDSERGKVSADALKDLVCGPLVGRRLELVQSVFEQVDRKHVGYIAAPDILAAHDARKHPSVMFGEKTVDQVYDEFQSSFQAAMRQVGSSFVNLYQWMNCFQYKATSRASLSGATGTNLQASTTGSGYAEVAPMTLLQALQKTNPAIAANYSKPSLSISTASMPPPVPSRLHRNNSVTTSNATLNPDVASPCATHTTTEFLKGTQFAACVVDPSIHQPSPSHYAFAKRSGSTTSPSPPQTVDAGTTSVLQRMRTTIKERGLRGLVALNRSLRVSDADSDGLLTLAEFKKALKGLDSVPLSDVDLRCLLNHLDQDRRSMASVLAALDMIREPMNYRRFQLVQAAFQSIDRDESGQLDASEIVQAYDASRHPDVTTDRTTEDAVFHEFLKSFDVDDDNDNGSSHKISLSQWTQYYQNVSFFVHDDDLFDLTIRNTWQLSAQHLPSFVGGMYASPPKSPHPGGHTMPAFQQPTNVRVTRGAGHGSSQAFAILQPDLNSDHHPSVTSRANGVNAAQPGCMFTAAKQSKELRRIIAQLRTALKDQGVVGFISLQRKFRLMDDGQNGSISVAEFHKALHETKVHLAPADTTTLFQYFDANHDGVVDFHDFLADIREPMSERRTLFVRMAFDILDADSNGVVEVSDIVDVYDARKHPDVLSGRKTEHGVFAEFLDTFGDIDHDGKVTFDKWTRYYADISASIDDDDYFEIMRGTSAVASAVLVTLADGADIVKKVQNDLGVSIQGVQARLRIQDDRVDAMNIAATTGINLTEPATASKSVTLFTDKKILILREASSAAPMEMSASSSSSGASTISGGDMVFHAIQYRVRQQRVAAIVQLRKRMLHYIDTKTGTISAVHCSECLSASLGLRLNEAHCTALFAYINQLPEARTYDLSRSNGGNGSNNSTGSRFLQSNSSKGSTRMGIRQFFHCVLGALSPTCLDAAQRVSQALQRAGNGRVFPVALAKSFQAARHPDVTLGGASATDVFQEFALNFELADSGARHRFQQWLDSSRLSVIV